MSDDHIKRFNLSENSPRKPFALAHDPRPPVRDKDNAQPVIPPPTNAHNHHPRLAPPGMMGSRAADESKDTKNRHDGCEKRPFTPLVAKIDKNRGPER